jgi:hypothetical protein
MCYCYSYWGLILSVFNTKVIQHNCGIYVDLFVGSKYDDDCEKYD